MPILFLKVWYAGGKMTPGQRQWALREWPGGGDGLGGTWNAASSAPRTSETAAGAAMP